MANLFKSAYSTVCAGARVAKETVKFVGRNTNKGGSYILDKTTEQLDKLASKMQENQVETTKSVESPKNEVVNQ